MTQAPLIKFTEEIWRNAEHSMGMTPWQIANKAIEITIAEQATQDNYETEWLKLDAEKKQDQFISADEARALGAGNAEWRVGDNDWHLCDQRYWALNLAKYDSENTRYRAIRKEVPAEPLASLPEELLTPEVKKALGEWIDSEQEPHAKWKALYAQQKYNTANGLPGGLGDFDWQARAGTFMDWLTIEPDWSENLFYQCVSKANLVKLGGVLMTREAAIAEWDSKKDACDRYYLSDNTNSADFEKLSGDESIWCTHSRFNGEYQLRPKALKDLSWLDMPVGVAVVDKTTGIQWIYAACLTDAALLVSSDKDAFRTAAFIDLTLAPADQQNWIAVQDGQTNADVNSKLEAAGICVVWKVGDVFKVTGMLMDGF